MHSAQFRPHSFDTGFGAMPYGVVMATGGAGGVATLAGMSGLAIALTAIAVLQALLIPPISVTARRGVTVPRWRFGLFTIALGLAVVAENLWPLIPSAAAVALLLAWITTLVLGTWRIVLVFCPDGRGETVDGTWFLAPAVLLGDAAATAVAAGTRATWIGWFDVAVCLVGIAGYLLVIFVVGRRLRHFGLKGSALAPWWISAGCGGLAAAAVGRVAVSTSGSIWPQLMEALVIMTWIIGTLLLVAVLAGCVWYAWRRPRGPWRQTWTPVFSMAVYAAGTDRLARQTDVGALHVLALVAVAATLVLWAANTALSLRQSRPWARPGP